MRASRLPNLAISKALMPPCAKTRAFGGVEMGTMKEKLEAMVITSMVKTRFSSLKKPLVATLITGKMMAISAVVDKKLVKIMALKQASRIKNTKGVLEKLAKNALNAPPSSL